MPYCVHPELRQLFSLPDLPYKHVIVPTPLTLQTELIPPIMTPSVDGHGDQNASLDHEDGYTKDNPSIEDQGRLLIVSNRLPINIQKDETTDFKWQFTLSSGGLVSGLSGVKKEKSFLWYGWPGTEIADEEVPHVKERLMDEHLAIPVLMTKVLAEKYYNGFSSTLNLSSNRRAALRV